MPMDSVAVATIHCYFHSSCHKTTSHFTIFSSSDFSPASSFITSTATTRSSINISLAVSRQNLSRKELRDGKCHQGKNSSGSGNKNLISSIDVKNIHRRSRFLWKKWLFGSKKFRSIILLNIITVVYASNIAVIKEVQCFTDPAYFSAVRFVVSSIPFLPFIFLQARDTNAHETRNSGLELGLWVSLGHLSEALGLITSDAGRASFISLFTVLVVPLLESMLGEIIPAPTWFGILMSVIGICILECSGSPPNIGDVFNFVSAIFFGIHTLRTEHISRRTRKEDFLPLLGYEVCVVAVLSTIWSVIGSSSVVGMQDSGEGISWDSVLAFPWIPALYTGVFSTGLCLWGEIAAMHEVSATETAVIYGMEPLWGAFFAWFLLGERWGAAGWIGASLILGGSLIAGSSGSEAISGRQMEENIVSSSCFSGSSKEELQKTVLVTASPVMVRSSSSRDMDINSIHPSSTNK